MEIASLIAGLIAVALYLLCFQLKSTKQIVACRLLSSVFYVLQYFLLGAFVGAAMDALSVVTSSVGYRKDTPFIKRHRTVILVVLHALVVAVGLMLYDTAFSLLAIAGVLFESASNWMRSERMLRLVSLCAVPCWLVYNVVYRAYGSALGSVLALISIITALVRYARQEKKKKSEESL